MNSSLEDGEAIGGKWLSKAIETAQRKVEARNYDMRKQLVEYDNVMNDQRRVIYQQREEIMDADAVDDVVDDMLQETVNSVVADHCPPETYPEQWDMDGLKARTASVLGLEPDFDTWLTEDGMDPETMEARIAEMAQAKLEAKRASIDPEIFRQIEKQILIQTLDHHWKEHLSTLDALRQVIYLRAYAQKNPINEYKQESFGLFQRMLEAIREGVTNTVSTNDFRVEDAPGDTLPELPDFLTTHFDPFTGDDDSDDLDGGTSGMVTTTIPNRQVGTNPAEGNPWADNPNIRRNDPCPCGSGQKYKHCHGVL